jgi:prepilin-type N-terminal cleavage/methylation domain-containing protein
MRTLRSQAGVTLIEIIVAITLLSALSVAMLFAMRIGLLTFQKANTKLMENRRVAGAQRLLVDQIEGLIPVVAPCTGMESGGLGPPFGFFQGDAQSMRLVSAYSLQQGWRGQAQILEMAVIAGEKGEGVRLIVNELPYAGPANAGRLCKGFVPDPNLGIMIPQFAAVEVSPASFVLADKLQFCRFSFLTADPRQSLAPPVWKPSWSMTGWPRGVRIEMAPLHADSSTLQPITVTAPIRLRRSPEIPYVDF